MESENSTDTPAVETADHARNGVELVIENGRIALEISTPQGLLRYELSENAQPQSLP